MTPEIWYYVLLQSLKLQVWALLDSDEDSMCLQSGHQVPILSWDLLKKRRPPPPLALIGFNSKSETQCALCGHIESQSGSGKYHTRTAKCDLWSVSSLLNLWCDVWTFEGPCIYVDPSWGVTTHFIRMAGEDISPTRETHLSFLNITCCSLAVEAGAGIWLNCMYSRSFNWTRCDLVSRLNQPP